MLVALTGPGGSRAQHAETWLVLFDLYRAIGQQLKFESLALDYAQQFGWSAPQWFSLPQLVAEAASDERPQRSRIDTQVGWVCPAAVDADAVARLRIADRCRCRCPGCSTGAPSHRSTSRPARRLAELFRHWATSRWRCAG